MFSLVRAFRLAALFHVLLLALPTAPRAVAQTTEYFPYYSTDTTKLHLLAQQQRSMAKKALSAPAGVSADYRQDLSRFLKDASDHVYYSIRHSALLDTVVNPFVQQIYQQVLQANPGLPPTRLFVSRNPVPNACALVDGTLLINVGLLARLENESQVAAVICHELSHIKLRHLEKGINQRLSRLHDPQFKKEVKAIEREEYNMQHRLRKLVMGVALHSLYHNRTQEKQADSLGYVLLARTSFDATQAYATLQLLDKIDEPLVQEAADLSRYFSCPGSSLTFSAQPVKSASIFKVKKQADELEKTDSLKTHPDCSKRLACVERLMNGKPELSASARTARFLRVQQASRAEVVQAWFDLEYYDHSLFEALQQLHQQPRNSYLQSMVWLNLYALKRYQQLHEYSQVVSNISDRNPESFNRFLRSLHDLQLPDFGSMAACFKQQTAPAAAANEHGLAARFAEMALANNTAEAELLKKEYLGHYKAGRLKQLVAPPPRPKSR